MIIRLPCWCIWSPCTKTFIEYTLSPTSTLTIQYFLSTEPDKERPQATWKYWSDLGWECRELNCYWKEES